MMLYKVAITLLVIIWSGQGYSASCKEIHLGEYVHNIRGTSIYCTTKAAIIATPTWNGEMGKIPFQIEKAIAIGKRWLKANYKKHDKFVVSGIKISRVGRSDVEDRWYFTLDYEPEGYPVLIPVVILMDGTVIEPKNY